MFGRPTLLEVKTKMRSWCASRDRSHAETRTKLIGMKVYGDDLEEIMSELITEGFLNEERFARNYVSGKFRISKWGRNKIIAGLHQQKISDYSIQKAMHEIDENEYQSLVDTLIAKKLKGDSSFEARQKMIASLQRKGFEFEVIMKRLKGGDGS